MLPFHEVLSYSELALMREYMPDEFYASIVEAGDDGIWPRFRAFVVFEPGIREVKQLFIEANSIVCRTFDRVS
jgi:hypothetical protein